MLSSALYIMAVTCTPIWALRLTYHEASANDHTPRIHKKRSKANKETLVVVIGSHRGGDLAWHSLQKHVLRPWGADLAVFVTDGKECSRNALTMNAQYLWEEPEHEDWGEVIDKIPGIQKSWKEDICHLNKQHLKNLWGGVGFGKCGTPRGSGGILLAYRSRVYQELEKLLNKDTHYSHVVLTRSDFLYGCDMQPVANFKEGVTVPRVEGYGGYTDRFAFMQDGEVLPSLNVTRHLMASMSSPSGQAAFAVEGGRRRKGGGGIRNLETALKWHWDSLNTSVHLFQHPAFTVATMTDKTRWRQGSKDAVVKPFNLLVKYPSELGETKSTCGERELTKELSDMALEIKPDKAHAIVNLYISAADAKKVDTKKVELARPDSSGEDQYLKVLSTDGTL